MWMAGNDYEKRLAINEPSSLLDAISEKAIREADLEDFVTDEIGRMVGLLIEPRSRVKDGGPNTVG